ncbi:MAG: DUF393 domain-containing protein, partial [Bacteriovoracaceae bacterium]|nr:DUF393 domain-containing protein [Bacteriovoracaceae bacterium]
DEQCPLCVRFKQALQFIDKEEKIQMTPLQESWIYESFPQLEKSECEQTIHLLDESGRVLKGGQVVEYLIANYPGVKKFAWLVESESGKKAVNFFYDKVNELRDKVKKDCHGCGKKRR